MDDIEFKFSRVAYAHYALVTEPFGFTRVFDIEYDGRNVSAEFVTPVKAGIYGFTSKEKRDRYISSINRQQDEREIAVACVLDSSATAPVVDLSAIQDSIATLETLLETYRNG